MIDDDKGYTLVSAGDPELKSKTKDPAFANATADKKAAAGKQKPQIKDQKLDDKKDKIERKAKVAVAYELGKLIAEKAAEKKIKKAVFDRAGYKYHGRVKALAEGAREGGLNF